MVELLVLETSKVKKGMVSHLKTGELVQACIANKELRLNG